MHRMTYLLKSNTKWWIYPLTNLFYKARQLKKANIVRTTWTTDGIIFVGPEIGHEPIELYAGHPLQLSKNNSSSHHTEQQHQHKKNTLQCKYIQICTSPATRNEKATAISTHSCELWALAQVTDSSHLRWTFPWCAREFRRCVLPLPLSTALVHNSQSEFLWATKCLAHTP